MEDEHAPVSKDTNYHEFQEEKEREAKQEEEEEEEEALSLCDMPLNQNSRSTSKCNSMDDTSFSKILRQSSSSFIPDTTELFEFFSGFSSSSSSDMCPADDIIFCGKLVPFKGKQDQIQNQQNNLNVIEAKKPPLYRRRSESLSSVTRSNSVTAGSNRFMMRNSRSLDYRRLREPSSSAVSPVPEVDRNFSARSFAAPEGAAKKAMKPRWYSLVFGTMRVPPEMELSDMKNRQVRRIGSGTMFPASDSGAGNRSSGKVSWRILKALSCKDHSSVAVTTSFALPQAEAS